MKLLDKLTQTKFYKFLLLHKKILLIILIVVVIIGGIIKNDGFSCAFISKSKRV